MDLDKAFGLSTFSAAIGGADYRFGEIPLKDLAHLQAWVRMNVPHPLEAVKPHLAGLDREDRAELLDRARRDALQWPPQVGTARGAAALLGTEEGQLETLWVALRVHQPGTTREQAREVFRSLKRDGVEHDRRERAAARTEGRDPEPFDVPTRIFAAAFGMDFDDGGEAAGPKGGTPAAGTPTTGSITG